MAKASTGRDGQGLIGRSVRPLEREREKQAGRRHGDQEAGDAAGNCEHQALEQRLRDDLPSARAERQPQGDLSAARADGRSSRRRCLRAWCWRLPGASPVCLTPCGVPRPSLARLPMGAHPTDQPLAVLPGAGLRHWPGCAQDLFGSRTGMVRDADLGGREPARSGAQHPGLSLFTRNAPLLVALATSAVSSSPARRCSGAVSTSSKAGASAMTSKRCSSRLVAQRPFRRAIRQKCCRR